MPFTEQELRILAYADHMTLDYAHDAEMKWRDPKRRLCAFCGTPIDPLKRQLRALYCSERCANRMSKQRSKQRRKDRDALS